jgi:hypothetical protein
LQAASINYRIAIGPHAGRKAMTLYSVPPAPDVTVKPLYYGCYFRLSHLWIGGPLLEMIAVGPCFLSACSCDTPRVVANHSLHLQIVALTQNGVQFRIF